MWLEQPIIWLLLVFLASNSQAADWPMMGGNRQRTGSYIGAKVRPPFVQKWRYTAVSAAGPSGQGPIVVGATLFQGTTEDQVRALNAYTGQFIWLVDAGNPSYAWVRGMVFDEGDLYYHTYWTTTSLAIRMELADQTPMWSYEFKYEGRILPAGPLAYAMPQYGGLLFSSTLYCLNKDTGAKNWELPVTPPGGRTAYGFSWHDGVVFVPGTPFYAIRDNPNYPDIKWVHNWPRKYGDASGIPTVANGKVYCLFSSTISGEWKDYLEVMDENTGDLEWRFYLGSVNKDLTTDGLRIFIGSSSSVYAVDDLGSSGSFAWINLQSGASSVVANGVVYFVAEAGQVVWAANAVDGETVWWQIVSALSGGGPLAFSDGLLFGNTSYDIYCYGKPINPHLRVNKDTSIPGDTVTYTITVNSYGGPSANITLVETLPSELEFVSASDGGEVNVSVVSWDNLAITADALKDVTLITRVKDGISSGIHELAPTAFLTYPGASLYKDVESEVAATTVSATPLPPTNLAVNDTCAAMELAWQVSISDGIDGYRVYRTLSPGGSLTFIATLSPSANTYKDATAKPNQAYYYVLTSISDGLESAYSNEAGTLHAQCAEPLTGNIRVFPNPFNSDKAVRHTVKFEVSGPASVRIYTTRGLKVWEGEIEGPGIMEWDGNNKEGKRVSPAVYLWAAEGEDWQERGTLVVE